MPAAITPPLTFVPLRDTKLFSPWQVGRLQLAHRIVQAPLTRMRGDKVARGVYVPVDRHITYYAQRATAGGLQITEALDICLDASAYPGVPGVFSDEQLAGWKRVTDAVHAKGGFIVAQLWHTGRASGPGMRGGKPPISSSNKPMSGTYLDGTACADGPPVPMTVDDIHEMTAEWAAAAKRAVEVAGFDAVEIHGELFLLFFFFSDPFLRLTKQALMATSSSSFCTTTSMTAPTHTAGRWRTAAAFCWRWLRPSRQPLAQTAPASAFLPTTFSRTPRTATPMLIGRTCARNWPACRRRSVPSMST